MSYFFVSADNRERNVAHMASGRAEIFVALTLAAAKVYEVKGDIIIWEDVEYIVFPEPFCELVERVFNSPINLLYVWSSYATGIYASLKEEHSTWLWGAGIIGTELQHKIIPVEVQRTGDYFKIPTGSKVFGPFWHKPEEQPESP